MEIASLDRPLGHYDAIFVSPHLDDVVYSCSSHVRSLIREGKRVLVVTVFTSLESTSACKNSSLSPFLNLEERRQEDHCAMKELGVDYHHLGLQEVLARQGGNCLPGLCEVARVWVQGLLRPELQVQIDLTQHLKKILSRTGCQWLIGPAAIGFHPDHMLVHKACAQVSDQVARTWWYHDFPYCTYPGLTQMRRCFMDIKAQDVQLTLSPDQVSERKRLISIYTSQIEAVFGTEDKMDETIEECPVEQFMQARQAEACDEEAALVSPLLRSDSETIRSRDAAMGILCTMLAFDLVVSMAFFYWVHYGGLDWDELDVSPRAMRLSYTVIFSSFVRVGCIGVLQKLALGNTLCLWSIYCAVAALFSIGGVRSLSLFLYYIVQIAVGYVEDRVVRLVRWQMNKDKPASSDRHPKVLLVSDYMPPQMHGISTHASGLVNALRELGCRVRVYSTMGEKAEDHHLLPALINPWNKDVKLAILPSFRLIYDILVGDWDVVHIVFPSLIPWPILLTAWLVGRPIYVSQHVNEALGKVYVHTIVFPILLGVYYVWSSLPVQLFSTINAGPTIGYILSNPYMKRYKSERLAVVPSSVDDSKFHGRGREEDRAALRRRLQVQDDRPIWLLVSRLAPEKDIQEMLNGLKHHVENLPAGASLPLLVIAGDGPCRKELEQQVERDSLPVRFLGYVLHKEVPTLYRACDVCTTNSVHETFGLTVIESLACGCPMVMPHCAIFDELYGDRLGDWMYEKGNVASLAKALEVASTPSAREYLADLRQSKSFNPNLFWSWKEAAEEQIQQYRRAGTMVKSKLRRHGTTLRFLLVIFILVTLIYVIREDWLDYREDM